MGGQQPPQGLGRYSGVAVPQVADLVPRSYPVPQNWLNPAVSGRDLIVRRDVLRQVASDLGRMADHLDATLAGCAPLAAPAAGAVGDWPQARQLSAVISRAHTGITQFASDLRQAHRDMARRLIISADRYDAAEHQITSLIHAAADPTATIVGSGGQDTPVQPGYGQHWTPQQRQAYYRLLRIENMPGNGGPVWTATYPIVEAVGFASASAAGYTWQQVQGLLAAASPGAISAAGTAYGQLTAALTEISNTLAGHGRTLAENWGGPTAVTAVSQVQQLHQTAVDLQANTWSAQQALQWYGPVLATFQASLPTPASAHPADVAAANHAAQQRMNALNSHIQTAFYQMPGAVNKNLPAPLGGPGGGGTSGGSTRGAGYARATGYPGSASAAPSGATAGVGGAAPSGTTQLAGVTSPVTAPPPSGPGTVVPGSTGGPGPVTMGGFGVLPPTPGPGGGRGGAGEFGLGGSAQGEPSSSLAEQAVAEPGAAGAVPPGEVMPSLNGPVGGGTTGAAEIGPGATRLGGFPAEGGPGAAGLGGADRSRQYWTAEEEETWGAEPARGGAGAADGPGPEIWTTPLAGRSRELDRKRTAWLGEDERFWGVGEPAVPPVIGA